MVRASQLARGAAVVYHSIYADATCVLPLCCDMALMIRQQACTDVEKVIGGNQHENVDVHVQRLDSYIKTHIDVLKIDIEGFEEGAMRGGSKAWELASVGAPV